MRMSSSPCPLKTTAGLYNEKDFSATLPIFLTLQHVHKTIACAWGIEHNALLGMGKERDATIPNSKAFLTWWWAPQALTAPPWEAAPLLWKKNSALMRPGRGSKRCCAPVPVLSLDVHFILTSAFCLYSSNIFLNYIFFIIKDNMLWIRSHFRSMASYISFFFSHW